MTGNINSEFNSTNAICLPEVSSKIFPEMGPQENIQTIILVCKTWHSVSIEVVRNQFLLKAQETKSDLNIKMHSFLMLTGKTVIDYCPIIKEAEERCSALTEKVYLELSSPTEKYRVCFGKSFFIKPEMIDAYFNEMQRDIQEADHWERSYLETTLISWKEREQGVRSKAFITLNYAEKGVYQQWNKNEYKIAFFPIELFDLKVQSNKIVGRKEDVTYTFPIKGKLVEFSIVPSEQLPMRNRALPIYFQCTLPEEFYVLRLDANAPRDPE